jgi:hypothetical protein
MHFYTHAPREPRFTNTSPRPEDRAAGIPPTTLLVVVAVPAEEREAVVEEG